MTTNHILLRRKSVGLTAVLSAIFLALILTLTPTSAGEPAMANVQPALLAMAAKQPDAQVRVIIQKASTTGDIESIITRMNGTVVKDLHIINAVVAEMGAQTAVDIALDASVNWVSLDSPVEGSQTFETFTVRDEFNTFSYANNNGTALWASEWQEGGESDGPYFGGLQLFNSQLRMKSNNRSLSRSVNLSDAATAVLSFDYRLFSFDNSSDYVIIQVSSDGGNSWRQLASMAGPANQYNMQSVSYDISADASTNTVIQLMTSPKLGSLDYFFVDNIKIEYTVADEGPGTTTPPINPMGSSVFTIADDFEAIPPTYTNNSGSRNWSSAWYEIGDNNLANNGSIYISQNQMPSQNLALAHNYANIWRMANLTGASYATLTFDYASALYWQDELLVEISNNGGTAWSTVDRIDIAPSGTDMFTAEYDISPYISSQTVVRFTAISRG